MEESSVEVQMFCKNFSLYLEDMCSFVSTASGEDWGSQLPPE